MRSISIVLLLTGCDGVNRDSSGHLISVDLRSTADTDIEVCLRAANDPEMLMLGI